MQEKTICAVSYQEIPAYTLDDVTRELDREISAALEDGYRTFLAEFARGAGMLFARCVNEQREKYPDIFLEVVLNPKNCERFFRDEWELLSKSNGIRGLCEECKQNYPLSVTRYLIEQSSRVIAVYGEQADNDTLYAMDYRTDTHQFGFRANPDMTDTIKTLSAERRRSYSNTIRLLLNLGLQSYKINKKAGITTGEGNQMEVHKRTAEAEAKAARKQKNVTSVTTAYLFGTDIPDNE